MTGWSSYFSTLEGTHCPHVLWNMTFNQSFESLDDTICRVKILWESVWRVSLVVRRNCHPLSALRLIPFPVNLFTKSVEPWMSGRKKSWTTCQRLQASNDLLPAYCRPTVSQAKQIPSTTSSSSRAWKLDWRSKNRRNSGWSMKINVFLPFVSDWNQSHISERVSSRQPTDLYWSYREKLHGPFWKFCFPYRSFRNEPKCNSADLPNIVEFTIHILTK